MRKSQSDLGSKCLLHRGSTRASTEERKEKSRNDYAQRANPDTKSSVGTGGARCEIVDSKSCMSLSQTVNVRDSRCEEGDQRYIGTLAVLTAPPYMDQQ